MKWNLKKKGFLFTQRLRNGYILKMRKVPYLKSPTGITWLISLGTSKSNRQLNDWINKRTKRKSVQKLNASLTGSLDYTAYRFVINTLRLWCEQLEPGDMLAFKCESAKPDKQYLVWGKWLKQKDSKFAWKGNPDLKCFTFYKQRV